LIVPEVNAQSSHYSVAVGGTFDHFHIGHKLLLTATALALEPVEEFDPIRERRLTVGVTGDALLKNKKYAEFLESWDDRCQSTSSFLMAIMDFSLPDKSAPRVERVSQPGPNGHYVLMKVRSGLTLKLVQITDPFGPTITDESIDALVVSGETRAGGAAVNEERAKKGWKSLDVFEIDVLHSGEVPTTDGESFASKISSTDIRRRRMEMASAQ
jgi:phosphopantetheine adenylyltransferase